MWGCSLDVKGPQFLEDRAQKVSDNLLWGFHQGRDRSSQEGAPIAEGAAISFLNKTQFSSSVVVNTGNRLFSLQSHWWSHLKWYNGLLFVFLFCSFFTALCKPAYLLQALKIDSPLSAQANLWSAVLKCPFYCCKPQAVRVSLWLAKAIWCAANWKKPD